MVWSIVANWQISAERNGESVFFFTNLFSNLGQNIMVVGGQHIGSLASTQRMA